jgi:diadenosine tetraphosphate (Ap4A) HIT family hydrolase
MDCYNCHCDARFDQLPARERIAADQHWRAAHAIRTALPGWLVLVPRRHVTTIAELTDEEAATLGSWQVRLSRALHEVTGCAKTYVAQFSEAEGSSHVHFHLVPRPPDLPADRRGPNIFGHLGDTYGEPVPDDEMDAMAEALRKHL